MQKARAELGHYSLSVITFRPNVQEPEEKKGSHLSSFCQVRRHSVSDRSNNFRASWMSLIHTELPDF